jgi:hypothetical protein
LCACRVIDSFHAILNSGFAGIRKTVTKEEW